jgi:hypothetical protein
MGLKGCVSTTFMEGEWLSFNCDGVALVIFSSGLVQHLAHLGLGATPIHFPTKMTCAHMFLKKTYTQTKKIQQIESYNMGSI